MSRIYKDIIEEVMIRLENEGESYNISRNVIFDLQNGWAQKIRAYSEMKSENVYEHGVYRGYNSYVDTKSTKEEGEAKPTNDVDSSNENVESDDYDMLEEEGSNYLMCLYVKVHRTRTKYKCSFKQGFVNIGNVDFAFSNAQGELEW